MNYINYKSPMCSFYEVAPVCLFLSIEFLFCPCTHNFSSPVQLNFDAQEGVIKLTGFESDLKEAAKLIEGHFISAVHHGRHDVNIAGKKVWFSTGVENLDSKLLTVY